VRVLFSVPALRFVGHLALATYGVLTLSFLIAIPLGFVIGDRLSAYFVGTGPAFGLWIVLGLLMGYRFGRRLPAPASRLLWVPSFLLLAYELYFTWYKLQWPGENLRAELWNNFIGSNCEASECAYEFLETAPFVSALAYSLGAELGRLKLKKSRKVDAVQSH